MQEEQRDSPWVLLMMAVMVLEKGMARTHEVWRVLQIDASTTCPVLMGAIHFLEQAVELLEEEETLAALQPGMQDPVSFRWYFGGHHVY